MHPLTLSLSLTLPSGSSHPRRSFTQPLVPSALCLVRWWRHLVQFNKRRSIMTSASELPLSSLTLAAPPSPSPAVLVTDPHSLPLQPLPFSLALILASFQSYRSHTRRFCVWNSVERADRKSSKRREVQFGKKKLYFIVGERGQKS